MLWREQSPRNKPRGCRGKIWGDLLRRIWGGTQPPLCDAHCEFVWRHLLPQRHVEVAERPVARLWKRFRIPAHLAKRDDPLASIIRDGEMTMHVSRDRCENYAVE